MKTIHQDAALIPWLAQDLNQQLKGFFLQDAFSANEQAATLVFVKGKEQLSMVLNIQAKTGLLFFYEHEIERQSGVQPLFKELIGLPIIAVNPHANNRSFEMCFEKEYLLLFKLYGALSNILLWRQEKVLQLFRPSIINDRATTLIDLIGKEPKIAITPLTSLFICLKDEAAAQQICLTTEAEYQVYWQGNHLLEALTVFAKYYLNHYLFYETQRQLLSGLNQKIKRKSAELVANENRLFQLQTEVPPEELGHLLMANLHVIKKGETSILVHDFYRNQPLEIKLKKDLSAAANAEHYYKKSRNRKYELVQVEKKIIQAKSEIELLQQKLNAVNAATRLRDLNALNPISIQGKNKSVLAPEKFRRFEKEGFVIYVGKGSENNDELTQKMAKKDDLWLHARGVAGSHVVIKQSPGKPFPKAVIEYAAQLAAYYSKAKGSDLVPVIYTPKKFVRKPKGSNPGQVVVDREEVILVSPAT
jgi:predicted ribosome quality control (RQC) complex YloA/Tae2 family protein